MTTKSKVGFSSCREFPKQSREKSLKKYKCSIWTSWISSRVVEKIFFCSCWKFSDFVAIHDHRAWIQSLFLYFSLSVGV
jgi:hypothetical protein